MSTALTVGGDSCGWARGLCRKHNLLSRPCSRFWRIAHPMHNLHVIHECVRLHCAVTEKQAIQTSVSVTTPHCITPRNSASSALHCMVQVSMHSCSCSLYTRNTAVAVRQRRLHKLHCTPLCKYLCMLLYSDSK